MLENDQIDRLIVDLLMEDGRMNAAKIARSIGGGVTERMVRYRMKRMIKGKVIKICPVVNPHSFGLTTRADVVLEVESDAIMDVANKVKKYDEVTYVACSIGNMDISFQVVARDPSEVYRFVTEVIGKIPGVRKTTTTIVPIVLKDVYQWRIPPNVNNLNHR
jgi:Lrp/AsnC family transcriptional regulator for asnA, asnC and gidA